MPHRVSAELVQRFRARSLERLDHVEAAWVALSLGAGSNETATAMGRHVHTLKGDADLLGFTEIRKLCAALESLFALGQEHGYQHREEINVLVGMRARFFPTPSPNARALSGLRRRWLRIVPRW